MYLLVVHLALHSQANSVRKRMVALRVSAAFPSWLLPLVALFRHWIN
jgi:hypothetical protein